SQIISSRTKDAPALVRLTTCPVSTLVGGCFANVVFFAVQLHGRHASTRLIRPDPTPKFFMPHTPSYSFWRQDREAGRQTGHESAGVSFTGDSLLHRCQLHRALPPALFAPRPGQLRNSGLRLTNRRARQDHG